MKDLTIRELQVQLPWTIRYSTDFRADQRAHKDFAHTLVHVTKAMGKLAQMLDDADHNRAVLDSPTLKEDHQGYIADLVICAMRMSNVFPGGVVDLQRVVETRLEQKNGVILDRHPAEFSQEQIDRLNGMFGDRDKSERVDGVLPPK